MEKEIKSLLRKYKARQKEYLKGIAKYGKIDNRDYEDTEFYGSYLGREEVAYDIINDLEKLSKKQDKKK